MILQDLNTATDVKLAVIAEVTQGSKPVLGAKVCHHNTIIIAIKIKCFIIIVISTIIVFVTVMLRKVVAEVERPQGAPILLTLKVEVHSDIMSLDRVTVSFCSSRHLLFKIGVNLSSIENIVG